MMVEPLNPKKSQNLSGVPASSHVRITGPPRVTLTPPSLVTVTVTPHFIEKPVAASARSCLHSSPPPTPTPRRQTCRHRHALPAEDAAAEPQPRSPRSRGGTNTECTHDSTHSTATPQDTNTSVLRDYARAAGLPWQHRAWAPFSRRCPWIVLVRLHRAPCMHVTLRVALPLSVLRIAMPLIDPSTPPPPPRHRSSSPSAPPPSSPSSSPPSQLRSAQRSRCPTPSTRSGSSSPLRPASLISGLGEGGAGADTRSGCSIRPCQAPRSRRVITDLTLPEDPIQPAAAHPRSSHLPPAGPAEESGVHRYTSVVFREPPEREGSTDARRHWDAAKFGEWHGPRCLVRCFIW
ncbi:hypothetical protein FB451DRAFT_1447035 [Mycena latifolia]|nr:hypothetical protein FB451DRAFT_1447035 [Mycena latifolia]